MYSQGRPRPARTRRLPGRVTSASSLHPEQRQRPGWVTSTAPRSGHRPPFGGQTRYPHGTRTGRVARSDAPARTPASRARDGSLVPINRSHPGLLARGGTVHLGGRLDRAPPHRRGGADPAGCRRGLARRPARPARSGRRRPLLRSAHASLRATARSAPVRSRSGDRPLHRSVGAGTRPPRPVAEDLARVSRRRSTLRTARRAPERGRRARRPARRLEAIRFDILWRTSPDRSPPSSSRAAR